MVQNDMWEDAEAFLYRHLPESSLSAFFLATEERDIVTITRERDGWWLNDHTATGESRFATVEEAKKAGDEIVDEAESGQRQALLKEAGLDPALWEVVFTDGLSFRHRTLSLEIVANLENGGWTLYDGDDPVWSADDHPAVVAEAVRRS